MFTTLYMTILVRMQLKTVYAGPVRTLTWCNGCSHPQMHIFALNLRMLAFYHALHDLPVAWSSLSSIGLAN